MTTNTAEQLHYLIRVEAKV